MQSGGRKVGYNIPELKTLTNFPRPVLATATYGVSRVRAVEHSLTAVKSELAAGREIAFAVNLTRPKVCVDDDGDPLPTGDTCSDQQNAEIANQYRGGVWRPVSDAWGGHAMVLVGYDDVKQVFIVKNSWGRDGAGKGRPAEADPDGFIEMSYDWLPKIYETYSVLETRDPSRWTNEQTFLGLWHMETDTPLERPTLAAYHLPGAFPSSALSGQEDRRIGTIYDAAIATGASASTRRVNGTVTGNRLRAYYGTTNIDRGYSVINEGNMIDAYTVDADTLAGWIGPADNPDNRQPLFASAVGYPEMQAARPDSVTNPVPLDFFGNWMIKGAGLDGHLEFETSIAQGVTGKYVALGGTQTPGVTLSVNPRSQFDPDDPCKVSITIPLATPQTLEGKLFCQTGTAAKHALITGTFGAGGATTGFYAYRVGKLPLRVSASAPSTSPWRVPVALSALLSNAPAGTTVTWRSNLDGELGTGAELRPSTLSLGTHTVTATARGGGETATANTTLAIENTAPTVQILQPDGVTSVCAGEATNFSAESFDLNSLSANRLPDANIVWTSSPAKLTGTGHALSAALPAGGFTVFVTATDDQGASARDSVTLSVETCVGTPPTVVITNPADNPNASEPDLDVQANGSDANGPYYQITLTATATDDETLERDKIIWTTDRADFQPGGPASGSQVLGSGTSITVKLNAGGSGITHKITLRVEDEDGQSTTDVRIIKIQAVF